MKKVASTFNIMQVWIVPDLRGLCFHDGNFVSRLVSAFSMNKMTVHSWELRSTSSCSQERIRDKRFRHGLALPGLISLL